LFVCLVFNGTSAQSRLLVPRKEWIKQTKYIYYDNNVGLDVYIHNEHKEYASGKNLIGVIEIQVKKGPKILCQSPVYWNFVNNFDRKLN